MGGGAGGGVVVVRGGEGEDGKAGAGEGYGEHLEAVDVAPLEIVDPEDEGVAGGEAGEELPKGFEGVAAEGAGADMDCDRLAPTPR